MRLIRKMDSCRSLNDYNLDMMISVKQLVSSTIAARFPIRETNRDPVF